ncbi:C40 family peptidase [Xenorhabdus koppenhoeferi]|uniref:Proteasome lid subunit RPN8/RPN11, contains Jab1/MPN metalloenzyme (JAMM) motif n=1 Tax=Xenorhabdus koppenhoeferi TaxID=351659 RepID=A0A1I7G6J5_9GAMM|nr:C40 family peptidase [Xenorhabdus koppenhoeferi]SFU44057.1 Proteasome lid subunit RPN8/RPN11, contains Jab1/MPN metalloenzyme (JAMM) motif [Xenorhabdus koppenhoeferi]
MITKKLTEVIFEHVKAEYPQEACGVICQKSRIMKYFPCKNLAQNPTERFELSPEDYANAEDWGVLIAIVHSHCGEGVTTQPSEIDRLQCDVTGLPWIIASWPEGDIRTIQPRGERDLIGRPFMLGHADCWSLIMDYYGQKHGIQLNNYSVDCHWWEEGENRYMDNWQKEGFVEIEGEPREGDVVIMQVQADVPNHAGVLVNGMLLHHLYGQLSQIVPYSDYWRDRTVMIVRKKALL